MSDEAEKLDKDLSKELDEKLSLEVDAEAAAGRLKLLAIVAMALAVLGLAVGVFGFLQARGAQAEVAALVESIAARPDKSETLERGIADIEERLVRLGGELLKLQRADQDMQRNTQAAIGTVTRDSAETRRAVNEALAQMGQLTERMEALQTAPRAAAAPSGPAAASDPAQPRQLAEEGVHIVQAGDTLSRIATQYGVSLADVQRANPTVNPRALQIGQRIVIPER